jgi:hypothetical protein
VTSDQIRFWDLAKGRLLDTNISARRVSSFSYARSGKMLAVVATKDASSPDFITLWDLTKMQPLGETFTAGGRPTGLVFSMDDKTLVSTSGLLWDVDPAALTTRICQMARRDLTETEWAKFMGTAAYHSTCGFPAGPTEPAPAPTASSAATSFGQTSDGRVLIAGGSSKGSVLGSAELFAP